MSIEVDKIAGLIRKRLKELGETAQEVEQRAGLPKDYITSILDGKYIFIRNNMTIAIADALGMPRASLRVNVRAASRAKAPAAKAKPLHPETELKRLRASIDNIDAAVVHMLAERFKATKAVGELKAAYDMPPADKSREAQQIRRLRQLAKDADLDPDFAEKFLNFIVTEVIRHHEKLQGKG
jgi:chorismate mutase